MDNSCDQQQARYNAHDQNDDDTAGPHGGRLADFQVLVLGNGNVGAVVKGQFLAAKKMKCY